MNSTRTKQVRILIVLALFVIAALVCVGRLVQIQLIDGEYYSRLASYNQTRERTISAKRGIIYDRNFCVLAQSDSTVTISINPQTIRSISNTASETVSNSEGNVLADLGSKIWTWIKSVFNKDKSLDEVTQDNSGQVVVDRKQALLDGLCEILDMEYSELIGYVEKDSNYVVIKKQVPAEVGDQIIALLDELNITSGVNVDEDNARLYPYGTLASQIIGFTGTDNQGLYGLEAKYESYLKGKSGRIVYLTDALERDIPDSYEYHIAAQDGYSIQTTIDVNIQYIIEQNLKEAIEERKVEDGGTVVVMNPNTGAIFGMASYPDFDPNNPFSKPADIDLLDWSSMTQEQQSAALIERWKINAITDTYEPGSTFKAIVAASGLETGSILTTTSVICSPIEMSGFTINCWHMPHHGTEDFAHGVYNSCNPVFVRLSLNMGLDNFYKYVRAFGFYNKTGIDLPGEGSSIFHANPTELNMATASFGQRFNITPIQLITAYAAIANGGYLLEPYIVSSVMDSKGNVIESNSRTVVRQVISKETSATVLDLLEGVVSEGGGGNAYVAGYRVAGKTGTSETLIDGQYIASFSAIAPADDPEICVLVILKNPQGDSYYGSQVAAPTAGKIVEEILEYMGVEREYSDRDVVKMGSLVTVPVLEELTVAEAQAKLSSIGLTAKIIGSTASDAVVVHQVPEANSNITSGSIVVLYTGEYTDDQTVTVPNLSSMTIDEACNVLHAVGLNIEVSGRGIAEDQSIPYGEQVSVGTVIKVDFRINVSD